MTDEPINERFAFNENDLYLPSWKVFIYKAAKGSIKATEAIGDYELFVLWRITKDPDIENKPESEYYTPIRSFLPSIDRDEAISLITKTIGNPITLGERPFHSREFYQDLWANKRTVSENELTHDAIHEMMRDWSFDNYLRRRTKIRWDYNSLDVTTCMIWLECLRYKVGIL
ncbi:hypothetical protein LLG95_03830 [bacterium]|nr:hypothetical protein [bacterium]